MRDWGVGRDQAAGGAVFVREDKITPHLGALLIRAHGTPGTGFDGVRIPHDPPAQVAACRDLGLTLTYPSCP